MDAIRASHTSHYRALQQHIREEVWMHSKKLSQLTHSCLNHSTTASLKCLMQSASFAFEGDNFPLCYLASIAAKTPCQNSHGEKKKKSMQADNTNRCHMKAITSQTSVRHNLLDFLQLPDFVNKSVRMYQ